MSGGVLVARLDDVAARLLSVHGPMSTMKLQKLAYYSQAWHLVRHGKRMFNEPVQAWSNGPVIPALWLRHKGRREIAEWPGGDPAALSIDEMDTIEWVLDRYGSLPAEVLSRMTHVEAPWRVTRGDTPVSNPSKAVIPDRIMLRYYGRLGVEGTAAASLAAASAALEGVNFGGRWLKVLDAVAMNMLDPDEAVAREIAALTRG